MNLTLERDALLAALARTEKVVEKRNTIPVLSNLLLRAAADGAGAKGTLTIVGTDLDMEVTTKVEAHVAEPGEITIPAATSKAFVEKLPPRATISIATDTGKEGRITLKSGRSRATLPTLDAADFPDLNAQAPSHTFVLPAGVLLDMIDRVAFAISSEETRYYLNGIYMHVADVAPGPAGADDEDGPYLIMVATDGHRLALRRTLAREGTTGMPGIIIPRKAAAEIARLIKPLDTEAVTLEVSATKLRMVAGITTLTTKLIDGTFPDYGRVIPAASTRAAVLDAAALGAAVDRVATVSSDRSRAVKFTFGARSPEQAGGTPAVANGGKAMVEMSVTGPDVGSATDEIEAESWAGDLLEIGFNGAYVADLIRALPGKAPKARIALTDAGSPALVTAEGDASALFVLMPMRV